MAQKTSAATKPREAKVDRGAPAKAVSGPLSPELLRKMDAYWRAANYLSRR